MFEKLTRGRRNRRAASLLLALAAAQIGAASAQNNVAPHAPPQAAPAAPIAGGKAPSSDLSAPANAPLTKAGFDEHNVDESALRYYATTGQSERTEAELRRLRALYPNWTPPENIYERSGGGVDEEDLWDLFSSGKLEELRAAIDERRAAEPGWEPSADLRAKYRAKAFRIQIVALAKEERWGDIVRLMKTSGARLEGIDVDILWTIADAFQRARQNANALSVYKTILTNNGDAGLRMATIQKSMSYLRMDEVEQLLLLARKDASGKSEFAPIAIDVARGRISAFLHDERTQEVEDEDLKTYGVYARGVNDPNQPALLAWYYFKLKRYSTALDWFKFALEHGGDAMVAHGLAHTLRFLGMKREAEEVAYAWREPLTNNSILFIDILETDLTKATPPYIEPMRLARYGDETTRTGSGEGAQALAWYAYNSCQYEVAQQWFERAMAWHPKGPTAYGYALTLRRLKKRKEMDEVINRYDGLFPQLVEILFPDGLYHPPTPCDLNVQARGANGQPAAAIAQAAQPAYGQPTPYGQQPAYGQPAPYGQPAGGGYVQDPQRQFAWGKVAGPGQAAAYGGAPGAPTSAADMMPKIDKAEFPIKIDPENPQRFAPSTQGPVLNAQLGDAAPAQAGGFGREPMRGMFPLVARRVPGGGPMPYERYGFALLPGYNGVNRPSSPTASEQIAPAGTLWSLERPNTFSLDIGRTFSAPPTASPRIESKAPSSPMLDLDLPTRPEPMRNG